MHLSQEDLADKVGVSVQTISKWERGVSEPSLQNRLMLKEILGIELYPRTLKSKRMISIRFLFLLGCVVLIGLLGVMSVMRDDEWIDITDKVVIEEELIRQKIVFDSIAYKVEDENIMFKINADFEESLLVEAFYPPGDGIEKEMFYDGSTIYFEMERRYFSAENSGSKMLDISLCSFKKEEEEFQLLDKIFLIFEKDLMREIYEGS